MGRGCAHFFFLLPWIPFPLRVLILPFLPAFCAGFYRFFGPNWGFLLLALLLGASYLMYSGTGVGWVWFLQWVAMGPIFVQAFNRARTLERAMGGALLVTVGLQLFILFVGSLERGISPWQLVVEEIEAALLGTIKAYGEMGVDASTLELLRGEVPLWARTMAGLVPGLVIAMDLLIHWWTLLVHRRVLAIWRIQWPGVRPLHEWGIPHPWVWLTILGGFLVFMPATPLRAAGINLLIVMGTIHLLQGLGVVASLFQGRRVPSFLRGLFYALIFLQQFLLLGVMALGLFDLWFDFRRRWGSTASGEREER